MNKVLVVHMTIFFNPFTQTFSHPYLSCSSQQIFPVSWHFWMYLFHLIFHSSFCGIAPLLWNIRGILVPCPQAINKVNLLYLWLWKGQIFYFNTKSTEIHNNNCIDYYQFFKDPRRLIIRKILCISVKKQYS